MSRVERIRRDSIQPRIRYRRDPGLLELLGAVVVMSTALWVAVGGGYRLLCWLLGVGL